MKTLGRTAVILIGLGLICCTATSAFAKKKHHAAVYSNTTYNTASLAAEIERVVRTADSETKVGIQVKSMKYNDTLYTENAHDLFTPASILKILTAEAALIYLGPDYKFPTQFVTDAKSSANGIINGNIYLVHSGDPSLTYYDLTDLMASLKTQQIQGINGNIYIDNTAYDQSNYGPGWIDHDERYCYAAPINASIINHNCLAFNMTAGKSGRVDNPHYYYSDADNSIITTQASSPNCSIHLITDGNNGVKLSGCISKNRYARSASVVVKNIIEYNKSLMQNLLKRFGIQMNGHIEAGAAPQDSVSIAMHQSKPLHMLITNMLKTSNNIIAGSLFKKMGELYSKQPGSWENGSTAVKQILAQKASVGTENMTILDGSGLSRDNRVTPNQMMQVLDYAYHNYSTNYEFISALPIAGIDGTLKRRLKNVARKVRAKTGTIAGVVSLAGYAISRDKEPIAFVIIINGHNGNIWKYREMEDKIVTALTNYSRKA